MATSVVMPALEMAQDTGRLLAWRRREGERVSRGEPLMEIETDKAVVEVEAAADGTLACVTAREGDVVAVGQVIAWILAPGEQPPAGVPPAPIRGTAPPSTPRSAGPVAAAGVPGDRRRQMSPKARRLASQRGLALEGVHGSGPGGVILAADLDSAGTRREVPGTVWRLMAERMSASWSTVPHFFLTRDIDAAMLADTRARLNAPLPAGHGISHTDLLVALVARVLRTHPRLNASWIDGALESHDRVNVAIATAIEQGVVAPVIHDADRLAPAEIARHRRQLVARAHERRLRPADLAGGTFTLSNLGMYRVQAFSAIVTPPQVAVLAVGQIADRVVARAGVAAVRPMMTVTLSCDHRAVDGARAAAFLDDLADAFEDAGGHAAM